MSVLSEFQDLARDPFRIGREMKAGGKKVAGYRCVFIPEEIIHAAGMHPYPVFGTAETVTHADSYFQPCTCEFIRNIFDHALAGRYDFLDAFVINNTCDVTRRLYDLWEEYIKTVPLHIINNPQKLNTEGNRAYYREELNRFRSFIEELAGKPIRDADLQESIVLYNRYRALMKNIYRMRADDPAPLSGAEALEVSLASLMMPKEEAVPKLEKLINELENREAEINDGPRVMITGSILDDPTLVAMVEEEGGNVVIDDLCSTVKNFWYQVDESTADPMEAIYRYQNMRTVCACLHPFEDRYAYLEELIDAFDVEAVIYFNLKYCHPFLYEAPLFREHLKEREIEVTFLETGHDNSGLGQLRTRVQAFIEMIDLY